MDKVKYWLWLSMALGGGNRRAWELTRQYENIIDAYLAISNGNFRGMTDKEISSFKSTHLEQAEKMLEYCSSKNINVICYDDEENYPDRLREIYNPPTVLYCYGTLDFIDDSVCVGVVGARKPSEYSVCVAEKICSELTKVDTVIVSGFAYGIDSVAHKSALQNKGKTVAVLGTGIDYNYPIDNASMKQIIAKHGAVISEYGPGIKSQRDFFIARNRLISALSLGVLIVEASSTSGSLNTAAHALSQGRDIFCVPPHDIFDERYCGVSSLLRDGAVPVFSHIDIMYQYYENFSHKLKDIDPFAGFIIKSTIPQKENSKAVAKPHEKKLKKDIPIEKPKTEIDTEKLSAIQAEIVNLIADKTMLADDITEALEIDISELLGELTELEMLEIIRAHPGKRYSLK